MSKSYIYRLLYFIMTYVICVFVLALTAHFAVASASVQLFLLQLLLTTMLQLLVLPLLLFLLLPPRAVPILLTKCRPVARPWTQWVHTAQASSAGVYVRTYIRLYTYSIWILLYIYCEYILCMHSVKSSFVGTTKPTPLHNFSTKLQ
jgi:hypothetical protein